MEQEEYLLAHIKDLASRCFQGDYLTHSNFLTESEQNLILRNLDANPNIQSLRMEGARLIFYGGREDAERRIAVFLPSYMDEAEFQKGTYRDELLSLIKVKAKNQNFIEELSHRDFLGALMNLGLEREQIGDILIDKKGDENGEKEVGARERNGSVEAYIYVMHEHAKTIATELVRVKHSSVLCELAALDDCQIETQFREIRGSVSSERIDAMLSMVFHLSRTRAKEMIQREQVLIDGRIISSVSVNLKKGQKVSLRGKGKFIYDGVESVTKKGRFYVCVRVYV